MSVEGVDLCQFAVGSDIHDVKQRKLVENLLNLSKKPKLKKPSRTEPALHFSEYNLVKSITGKKGTIQLRDLTKSLKNKSAYVTLGKKVDAVERKAKKLLKPLDKPQADRIRRTIAYEDTRKQLNRWDAIVTSNRAASSITFPLNHKELNMDGTAQDPTIHWGLKSELQLALDVVAPVKTTVINTVDDEFPLTMAEMIEKRRETAKLRAIQSYKEAKARRQNKIKSKKFHKMERRAKERLQNKEFEILEKANPEAAMEKLEDIQRARAQERISLRHKSTGQWARNNELRAKYNKESRQILAQQLAIGRDLTQKLKKTGSDSESDDGLQIEDAVSVKVDCNNPWTTNAKINPTAEITDLISNLRKFQTKTISQKDIKSDILQMNGSAIVSETIINHHGIVKRNSANSIVDSGDVRKPLLQRKKKKSGEHSTIHFEESVGSLWTVTEIEPKDTNGKVFGNINPNLKRKMKEKCNELSKAAYKKIKLPQPKTRTSSIKNRRPNIELLELKPKRRPILDDGLNESSDIEDESQLADLKLMEDLLETPQAVNKTEIIDPNKFINMKPVKLNSSIPDMLLNGGDENEDNDVEVLSANNQQGIIAEAFCDDGIVDEFHREKQLDIQRNTPKDVDLTLPGWGFWGGKNVRTPKWKHRRFIVKAPAPEIRRDSNRGNLIINEDVNNAKVSQHMVSGVPFPYKDVKDYEISLKTSIDGMFIPQAAHRKFIEPAVITKLGTIIEPMTEDILLIKTNKKSMH